MAMPASVVDTWDKMNESQRTQVINFMDFLTREQPASYEKKVPSSFLGCLEGGLIYMADDFDKTPDDFREYM